MKQDILRHKPASTEAIAQMDQFQEENRKQIEHQKSITNQIILMKNVATTYQADTDQVFEENMKHLEEEHRYQLQHQAEMMCQIQQMKEIVQDEIDRDKEVEDEIRMRELMHLKEKERQKELIKQIRLMEEIEEIQEDHAREQFYHDQEQELSIQEKEMEHERSREHNLSLMHQLELMTQINLIQDTVMILDEVTQMDADKEKLISQNLEEIEKRLDILDEVERGTAIASERVDVLFSMLNKKEKNQLESIYQIAKKLDEKITTLDEMEKSTIWANGKTNNLIDTVRKSSEKEQVTVSQLPTDEVGQDVPKQIEDSIIKIDKKVQAIYDLQQSNDEMASQVESIIQTVRVMNTNAKMKLSKTEQKVDLMEENSVKPKTDIHVESSKPLRMEQIDQMQRNELLQNLKKIDLGLRTLEDLNVNTLLLTDDTDRLIEHVTVLPGAKSAQIKDSLPTDHPDGGSKQFAPPIQIPKSLAVALRDTNRQVVLKDTPMRVRYGSITEPMDEEKAPITPPIPLPYVPTADVFEDPKYKEDLLSTISVIEKKVIKLERLYVDVLTLHSQAGVLHDEVEESECHKKLRKQMKGDDSDTTGIVLSVNQLTIDAEKDGKLQNITILEKEISDLLKESEASNIGKILETVDEWEVVDKHSLQKEMQQQQQQPQQFITDSDVAKRQVGKNLTRTYSTETTELLAKVDGMKESVEEQKALRMLERENSLEFLDYGGTGGPVEQEAALLLERVDQGFTQIITDQSESHLMKSLEKELTPDREYDTTLAEHEREKVHQQELMRQIQELQHDALLQEESKTDELIATLDEEHRIAKERQAHLQDQVQALMDIEITKQSVLKRQDDLKTQMEQVKQSLNLKQEEAMSSFIGMENNQAVMDSHRVQEYERLQEDQIDLMKQISLMQQDGELLNKELQNIELQEQKMKDSSEAAALDPSSRKPIEVLLEEPVVRRRKQSNLNQKPEGLSEAEMELEMQSQDLNQQLRRLSVEYQKLMWDVEKQTSMESLTVELQEKDEQKGSQESSEILMNLLPKGGRVDPDLAFEPIIAMRRTIVNMKEDVHNQKLIKQLDFMSSCIDAVEAQMNHLKTEKKIVMETL